MLTFATDKQHGRANSRGFDNCDFLELLLDRLSLEPYIQTLDKDYQAFDESTQISRNSP